MHHLFTPRYCFAALLLAALITASPIPADAPPQVPTQAYIDRLRYEGHTEQEIASHLSTTQPSTQRHPTPAFPLAFDDEPLSSNDPNISATTTTSTSNPQSPNSISLRSITSSTKSLTDLLPSRRRISHLFRFTRRHLKRDTSGDVSPSDLVPRTMSEMEDGGLVGRINGFIEAVTKGRIRIAKHDGGSTRPEDGKVKRAVDGALGEGMGGVVVRPRGGVQWYVQ
ncbi:MAG: hypothetical protein M1820_006923 [Bogoriella megaspora]|nr:MAG: hypothetical protein M1820_006923 [Bogoriella megaspora]